MRSKQNVAPLALNLWNARLFIRFIGVLKCLGCIDEYIVSLPDYGFAIQKTLDTLGNSNFSEVEARDLKSLEFNLISLRNTCFLIDQTRKKSEKPLFSNTMEEKLSDILHQLQLKMQAS